MTNSITPRPVIVTGAAGFIGRHVLSLLRDRPYPVLAVDQMMPAWPLPSGIQFHQADLAEPSDIMPNHFVGDEGFVLVHLAWNMQRGDTYVPQAESITRLASLLDYWQERGLERVVGIGSAEEYGNRSGQLKESDLPGDGLSPYGWAKRCAGQLVTAWGCRYSRPTVWLRPFLVYGPGQQGSMMLPYAWARIKAGERAEFTDGLQQRDFVFVADIAAAIVAAIAVPDTGQHVLNIGTGIATPVRDVLSRLGALMQAKHLFDFGARSRRPGEPEQQCADIQAARDVLGWQPQTDWQTGIEKMVMAQ